MSEWIKCSERMPNEEDVLVYCSDTKEQMVGFHKGKGLFQFFYMNGVGGGYVSRHTGCRYLSLRKCDVQ